MKILVVDDDKINNKMLCKKLSKRGYEVVEAFCAKECLEVVKSQQVDLILLDIMMPDMMGSELLTILRKDFSAFDLPIVMVTGKSETEFIVECLRAGANDYIVKPINIEVALARIGTQLKLKSLNLESLKKIELETAQSMIITYNHEINNPLTIAIGLLSKVKEEHHKETINKALGALYRVSDIVKEIDKLIESHSLSTQNYTDSEKMIKIR